MRKAATAILTFTAIFSVAPAAALAAGKLPLEAFAMLPVVKTMELSPDGRKVALLVNNEGTSTILVQKLGKADGRKTSIMSTDNKQYSFKWFQWVSNDRIIVATLFPSKRRNQNTAGTIGGTDTNETRLLSAKADGSQVITL
jgi:hypothetical protein